MFNIANTNDPEILKQAVLLLEDQNRKLTRAVLNAQEEIARMKGEDAESLQMKLEVLLQQVSVQNKKLYGATTEKRTPSPNVEHDTDSTIETKPRTGHGPTEQKTLPFSEQVHTLDTADKQCPKCDGVLEEFKGQFEESEEITVEPRGFIVVRHKRQKYMCSCCKTIDTALGPQKLIAAGRYSVEFAVEAAVAKYVDHMPLDRQTKVMKREGLDITSQTLWDQIWPLSQVLKPSYDALQEKILKSPVIFADETTWRLLSIAKDKTSTKTHYNWSISNTQAVYQRIMDSRSAEAAREMFKDYAGIVMCDGYAAYEAARARAGPFTLAHCWAHVRRKFIETEKYFPAESKVFIDLIAQLYAIEKTLPSLFDLSVKQDAELQQQRLSLRATQSAPVLSKIKSTAIETAQKVLPHSALRKAIDYMLSLWDGLTLFTEHALVPLDNNHAERSIRPVVLGRKNHLGSKSDRGTQATAIFYSLLQTAKMNQLHPRNYMIAAAKAALNNPGTVSLPLPIDAAA